jgi:hypothetical protein
MVKGGFFTLDFSIRVTLAFEEGWYRNQADDGGLSYKNPEPHQDIKPYHIRWSSAKSLER